MRFEITTLQISKDTWVPPDWPSGQEHIQTSTPCEMDQMGLMMLAQASIFLDFGMGRL